MKRNNAKRRAVVVGLIIAAMATAWVVDKTLEPGRMQREHGVQGEPETN